MALIARNGVWLTRQAPAAGFSDPFTASLLPGSLEVGSNAPIPPGGLVQAVASGMMRLAAASNLQLYSSSSNVLIGAQGASNVIDVGAGGVTIHGDLRVKGAVDALMTSELHVRDKVVRVSAPVDSNAVLADADLDGAGLAVARGTYDKSITWSAGAPGAPMLSSNAPYWTVKGGALRLSVQSRADPVKAAAGGSVGYGFLVNAQEQLEIFKFWTDTAGGAERRMRVWCAGAPRTSSDTTLTLPLPLSANPYAD